MSQVPQDLKYTKEHEWVRKEADGTVTVGITDHAQEALGDLVFVEVPEVGQVLAEGDACAVVESVKAASDVYSPLSGSVSEVNTELAEAPEIINQDPYDQGWIFKMSLADTSQLGGLLEPAGYQELIEEED